MTDATTPPHTGPHRVCCQHTLPYRITFGCGFYGFGTFTDPAFWRYHVPLRFVAHLPHYVAFLPFPDTTVVTFHYAILPPQHCRITVPHTPVLRVVGMPNSAGWLDWDHTPFLRWVYSLQLCTVTFPVTRHLRYGWTHTTVVLLTPDCCSTYDLVRYQTPAVTGGRGYPMHTHSCPPRYPMLRSRSRLLIPSTLPDRPSHFIPRCYVTCPLAPVTYCTYGFYRLERGLHAPGPPLPPQFGTCSRFAVAERTGCRRLDVRCRFVTLPTHAVPIGFRYHVRWVCHLPLAVPYTRMARHTHPRRVYTRALPCQTFGYSGSPHVCLVVTRVVRLRCYLRLR